jgi:hypothetical protein
MITCQAIALLRAAWVVDADGAITLALGARRCHHLRWFLGGKVMTKLAGKVTENPQIEKTFHVL